MSRKRQPRDELGRFISIARVKPSAKGRSRVAVKPKAKQPARVAAKPKAKQPARVAAKSMAKQPARVAVKPKAKQPARVAAKPKAKQPARVAAKPKAKQPARVAVKPKVKQPARVAAKPKAKQPARVAAKPKAKQPARVAAKPKAKQPARVVVKPKIKPPARVAAKPKAKPPAWRRKKGQPRDGRGRFISRKKLPRPPGRKPAPPPKRVKKPEFPRVAEASRRAEVDMQSRLLVLQDSILLLEAGLDMAVQTMVNRDGTVDGELTIRNLPDEWREERTMGYLVATLSSALRTFEPFAAHPAMGGAFWCSFGVRFGPQNEAEIGEMYNLYKRHRGLFQIGTYPTPAWGTGALQIALVGDNVGLKAMLESLMKKRGLPPSVVMIRFIWTPDGQRPGHYKGEK